MARQTKIDVPTYNPLDYENLARNVADRLMATTPSALPLPYNFNGAGVYALFYIGDFEPYASVRSVDASNPIYVGKAVPKGGRKGEVNDPLTPLLDDGAYLSARINQHIRSIDSVDSLRVTDFRCRYLRVTAVWITMAERLLITKYHPVWNGCLDGFGIHDPGKDRSPIVSWWDALHPGRPAALRWNARIQYVRTEHDARNHLASCLQLPLPERPIVADEDDADSSAPDSF